MPDIYLDNASTTATDPRVLDAMLPYFSEKYGNPHSNHKKGKEAKIAVDNAREIIAKILNCRESEIVFTDSATEANNLAILGIARANMDQGKHLITSKIEHSSVRAPLQQLEKEGFEVTWLNVDSEGFVSLEELENAIRPNTILVSIMHANNEIGTIEPIAEIGEICEKHKTIFHTDAAQTAGYLNLDVQKLNIDLMTINGSKIYGPKGIGALYIKRELQIRPIIFGGAHEKGLRAGTHNVPGIVGLAKALELVQEEKDRENQNLEKLRNKLMEALLTKIKGANLNGPKDNRLPNNLNISIPDVDADRLLLILDEAGIYVSTGSACSTGEAQPSETLKAIGLPQNKVHSSIRFSLGKKTTETDIDYVIETLPKIIEKMQG